MKQSFLCICIICSIISFAQNKNFTVKNISLPPELSYYDNQFSGLSIYDGKLFLMSESRLQDSAEAKLYSLTISDIEMKMADSNFILPYKKIAIKNLDVLRNKMEELGDEYEGLEAISINEHTVYLTVETTTPSKNCYLLKGLLTDSTVELDAFFLPILPKPVTKAGEHIYNAGFESAAVIDNTIFCFYEYNFFDEKNLVVAVTPFSLNKVMYQIPTIEKLPFRLTDITKISNNTFTAINYFYKGGGNDAVYRTPKTDKQNDKLIRDEYGYKSYCRLIKIKYKNEQFSWEPLWQFPYEYMGYNWEGIAAYKNGYFIINDKYTREKPYSSVLLYLEEGSGK